MFTLTSINLNFNQPQLNVLRLIICSLSLTSVVSCLSFLSVTDLEDRSPSLQLYRLLFTDICKVNIRQKQFISFMVETE